MSQRTKIEKCARSFPFWLARHFACISLYDFLKTDICYDFISMEKLDFIQI